MTRQALKIHATRSQFSNAQDHKKTPARTTGVLTKLFCFFNYSASMNGYL
jgi:hypothetical protein